MKKDRWIIDGNYLRTLEQRLAACDTVFFLDFPPEVCLAGAKSRIGRPREDMPWVETEWILDFQRDQMPQINGLLEKHRGMTVFRFRSREEAEEYLGRIEKIGTEA